MWCRTANQLSSRWHNVLKKEADKEPQQKKRKLQESDINDLDAGTGKDYIPIRIQHIAAILILQIYEALYCYICRIQPADHPFHKKNLMFTGKTAHRVHASVSASLLLLLS